MKTLFKNISFLWCTWFLTGRSKYAPGTVGSFFALPLAYLCAFYGTTGILIGSLFIFLTGWLASQNVLKTVNETDPGFIVIDEVLGQTLTFILIPISLLTDPLYLAVGFALFRFFDIVKIWPASFFDKKVHTAFGLMADDIVAGIYASFGLYVFHLIYS